MGVEIFISFSTVYIMYNYDDTPLYQIRCFSHSHGFFSAELLLTRCCRYSPYFRLLVQIVKDRNTVNIYWLDLICRQDLDYSLKFRLHCQERKGPYAYFSSLGFPLVPPRPGISHFRHVRIG